MKFKTSTLLICFYIVLLTLLPFTWWPSSLHLLGGDDIKYEYIEPYLKLSLLFSNDMVSLAGSVGHLIHEISAFPFYLILTVLHFILPFINTQHLVHSVVLVGGFIGFFWMLRMIPVDSLLEGEVQLFVRFVAANVYAFSTFNIITMWDHQLPVYVYISTLPFMLGFILRSTQKYSAIDSLAAALLLTFSPSPYGGIPWLAPVVICGLPLIIALACERPKNLTYTLSTFLIACLLLMFPAIIAMVEFGGYSTGTFSSDALRNSIHVFTEVNKNNALIYPISLVPPQDFLQIKLYFYREFPWIFETLVYMLAAIIFTLVAVAVILSMRYENRENRGLLLGVFLSWLLSVILYAGGGGETLRSLLVAVIEKFPFLLMFRNNYDKFNIAISIFSSLIIYYLLTFIYINFYRRERFKDGVQNSVLTQ